MKERVRCWMDRAAEEPLARGCRGGGGGGRVEEEEEGEKEEGERREELLGSNLESGLRIKVPWSCGSVLDLKGKSPRAPGGWAHR